MTDDLESSDLASEERSPAVPSLPRGGRMPPMPASPPETASINETSGMLALIERVVLDPAVDVEKLERLLAVQERILDRNDKLAFNAAKGRVLTALAGIKIIKNKWVQYPVEKNNPRAGLYDAFKYAPLEEIDKVLGPLLAREEMDLSYSDEPQSDGRIMIRGRLKHLPGGHYEDSFMAAPLDTSGGKNNVQAVGSSNSYLRRYVACNIFNIVVVGDDDDGAGGPMTEEQVDEILELIKKAKAPKRFLNYMHWPDVSTDQPIQEIVKAAPARDYRKALNALEDLIAKQKAAP